MSTPTAPAPTEILPPRRRATRPKVNIAEIAADPTALERAEFRRKESPAEQENRLRREEREHKAKIWKDLGITIAAVLAVIAVFVYCLNVAMTSSSPEAQKWAQSIVTAIATGAIGFLVGRGRE